MDEYIELIDEEGNEVEFEFISKFKIDDTHYAALTPTDGEEDLIYILKVEEDESGELILVGIEDDEELEDAIEEFENQQEKELH